MQASKRPSAAPRGRRPVKSVLSAGTACLLLAGSLLAAPAAGQATTPAESRVAVVDGMVIEGPAFRQYLARYARSKLYHGGSEEQLLALAEAARDEMIQDFLLARAAEDRGIAGDEDAVDAQIEALRERYGESETWPEVEPRLPEIRETLLSQSRVEALREEVMTVAAPGEARLRGYYADNPELFTQPAAYDVDLILIGVPPSALSDEWSAAQARAAALRDDIARGTPFAEIAAEHSSHDSAGKGGAVGRIHKGQLPGPAQSVVEEMEPGAVSQPVRILEGYLILHLNARYPAALQPFEKVRERAEALYRRERSQEQWTEFLAELREDATITAYDLAPHVRPMMSGD